MQSVKTAISIQKPLFDQAEKLAKQMKVSRSHLMALALEEFIERRQNRELLAKINASYKDGPDPADVEIRKRMKQIHRRIAEAEW